MRSDLRQMPRPVWFLFAGSFVNRFGSFVLPFLVLYLTRRGYTPAQAGFAISTYGLGSLGAAAVGGQLADRAGRRQTIAASMLTSAAVMLALTAVVILFRYFPPPTCPTIEGVLVVAGECP